MNITVKEKRFSKFKPCLSWLELGTSENNLCVLKSVSFLACFSAEVSAECLPSNS